MTGHELEVAAELLVYQCINLVGTTNLNHEGLLSTLLVLSCHHQVTLMSNEDLDVIGSITQVFNTLKQNLAFHGSISFLPVLFGHRRHILRVVLT